GPAGDRLVVHVTPLVADAAGFAGVPGEAFLRREPLQLLAVALEQGANAAEARPAAGDAKVPVLPRRLHPPDAGGGVHRAVRPPNPPPPPRAGEGTEGYDLE